MTGGACSRFLPPARVAHGAWGPSLQLSYRDKYSITFMARSRSFPAAIACTVSRTAAT